MENNLLKKATNETAYLKMGLQGFPGSGKTYTSSLFAIGLHGYIGSKKPIAFIDTETGSDFVLPVFTKNKIEVITCRSRAFIDLLNAIKEAEKKCDILIIDSITHFWVELLQAYQTKKNVNRLTIRDWMPIKQEWRQFTDLYLISKLHIIMCGRAGWDFGYEENENGEKEMMKTGTKMKVEGETGFEPSLLIEMERIRKELGKIGTSYANRGWVLKDRSNQINGRHFDNPTFEDIIPHIQVLNLKGTHQILDISKSSKDIFTSERSMAELFKKRDIALEEIKDELVLRYPSMGADDKNKKIEVLKEVFSTSSWTAISNMSVEQVQKGLEKIKLLPLPAKSDRKDR